MSIRKIVEAPARLCIARDILHTSFDCGITDIPSVLCLITDPWHALAAQKLGARFPRNVLGPSCTTPTPSGHFSTTR